jgi:hypothetical protein
LIIGQSQPLNNGGVRPPGAARLCVAGNTASKCVDPDRLKRAAAAAPALFGANQKVNKLDDLSQPWFPHGLILLWRSLRPAGRGGQQYQQQDRESETHQSFH